MSEGGDAASEAAAKAPTPPAEPAASQRLSVEPASSFQLELNELPAGALPVGPSLNPMVAAAFTGAVDAHNQLLERLSVFEVSLKGTGENQTKIRDALQELARDQQKKTTVLEERLVAQDARMEELQKQVSDGQAHSTMLEKRVAEFEVDQEKKQRALDEKLTPELRALEKAVEELVGKHSEMISRTLPQWQAELSSEIQKLTSDLSEHKTSTASREKELEEKLVATNVSLGKACKDLDARITTEVNGLKAGTLLLQGQASMMAEELSQTSTRLDAADQALFSRLETRGKELEAFAKDEIDSSGILLRTDMMDRYNGLEEALKQETFERLQNTKHILKEFEGVNTVIIQTKDEAERKSQASSAQQSAEIQKLRAQVDIGSKSSPWNSSIDEIRARLAKDEENITVLQNSLKSSDERLGSTTGALLDKLQTQSDDLEQKIRDEAGGARAAVRADEGSRVTELEASLKRAGEERQEFENGVGKELQALRDKLSSTQQASMAHADDAAAAVVAKLEPVKQACSNLSQDIDELTRMQEHCEGGLTKLEEHVGGLARKAAPIDDAQRRLLEMEWYLSAERSAPFAVVGNSVTRNDCLSCGRRAAPGERSVSPGRGSRETSSGWACTVGRGGLGETTPPPLSAVGWAQRSPPQPPRSARPASASYHRHLGEPVQEAPVSQAPVGPAHSAARYQRKPGPSAGL